MSHRCSRTLLTFVAVVSFGCGAETPTGAVDDDFAVGGTITGHDASVTLSLNGMSETFSGAGFTFTLALALGSASQLVTAALARFAQLEIAFACGSQLRFEGHRVSAA